jgi:predicted ATPase
MVTAVVCFYQLLSKSYQQARLFVSNCLFKKKEERYTNEVQYIQYIQRHSVINHCDRRITHLGDLDISFVLLNISAKFLLHLECYLL